MRTVRQTSVVPAPVEAVWSRIVDFDGINHELMPLMRMTVPRRHRSTTIANVPVGQPLGRSWIFYLGFLPLDYDGMTLTELVPGSHFQEVSTMASMRRWEHRRALRPLGPDSTEVTDTLVFEPRIPLAALVERLVRRIFAHRHRRLAAYFATAPQSPA